MKFNRNNNSQSHINCEKIVAGAMELYFTGPSGGDKHSGYNVC